MSELLRPKRVDEGKKKKLREKCTRARWEEISGFGWIPIDTAAFLFIFFARFFSETNIWIYI